MPYPHRVLVGLLLVAGAIALAVDSGAAAPPPAAPATSPDDAGSEAPATANTDPKVTQAFAGIRIDRTNRLVDVDATVIAPSEPWLELLACKRNTLEHESLLILEAEPSHIHTALLLLGLKPGSPVGVEEVGTFLYGIDARHPLRLERTWPKFLAVPAKGPRVRISLVYQKDGRQVEQPASEWVIDRETKRKMASDIWLFTGSSFYRDGDDRERYLADINGTAISLVNFGDDLLARDTAVQGGQGGGNVYGANEKTVPPPGTKVKIRLRPGDAPAEENKARNQPGDEPPAESGAATGGAGGGD